MTGAEPTWNDAAAAAALLAVDPSLGGAVVRAPAGSARDAWLARVRAALPDGAPWRRLPAGVDDGRLLGGIDLGAALGAGRRAFQRGVLADAHGGALVVPLAERMDGPVAARIAAALDAGEVFAEREGFTERAPARFMLLALDEGEGDERVPAAIGERLAFRLDLSNLSVRDLPAENDPARAHGARQRLGHVAIDDEAIVALVAAADALGADSLRAPLLALQAARAAAALDGRDRVSAEDLGLAARLVLGPRATRRPVESSPATNETQDGDTEGHDGPSKAAAQEALADTVLAAAAAVLPAELERLWAERAGRRRDAKDARGEGRGAAPARRGRPVGVRPGAPTSAGDLHLAETLKAAAPWKRLRGVAAGSTVAAPRLPIRKSDLRVRRFKRNAASTLIFVVDASGSAALHRLAEAKGAVELLLAEAYARRTEVALIAFRGTTAETLLPPTRSLARARRRLADLAGGGATPLASALDSAAVLVLAERARGRTPRVVVLTDGRGNVALDGQTFRTRAETDAQGAARRLRALGSPCAVVDIAPRGRDEARRLADALGARHAALPYVDAAAIRDVARALEPADARAA